MLVSMFSPRLLFSAFSLPFLPRPLSLLYASLPVFTATDAAHESLTRSHDSLLRRPLLAARLDSLLLPGSSPSGPPGRFRPLLSPPRMLLNYRMLQLL